MFLFKGWIGRGKGGSLYIYSCKPSILPSGHIRARPQYYEFRLREFNNRRLPHFFGWRRGRKLLTADHYIIPELGPSEIKETICLIYPTAELEDNINYDLTKNTNRRKIRSVKFKSGFKNNIKWFWMFIIDEDTIQYICNLFGLDPRTVFIFL